MREMKTWPVPSTPSKGIPAPGTAGCFWEDRGDRRHCGVDIYAPLGSEVVSVGPGKVIETGVFTSPDEVPYWNVTHYVIIKNDDGIYCRYAEMGDVLGKEDQIVKEGEVIGHVGQVLSKDKITDRSPEYIRKLKEADNECMLHFEVFSDLPAKSDEYLGGNWFGESRPPTLLDAGRYLTDD
jgi:murein DD-endopeptidase MepM/ murein hydrolase activator NlpD